MKYCIIFVIMILIAGKIHADPAFMIGINGNATTITGNDSLVQRSDLRLGLGFKVGFEQNFFKHFSLITGIGFDSRGEENILSKNLTADIRQENTEKIKILSLQIPVLAQLNFPISIFRLSLFGGPELGFLVKYRKTTDKLVFVPEANGQPARVDTLGSDTINFARDVRMIDLGINAGLGFEINTGNVGAVFIRPSVYIGLLDILESNFDDEANTNLNGKHQVASIAIGYKFNIKARRSENAESNQKHKEEGSSSEASEKSNYDLEKYRSYKPEESQDSGSDFGSSDFGTSDDQ
ncbi:MAG TPA: porin family protein [Chitinispirillaceae bacterium]|nr:porin family protein [Chitinispirillaceae bacterium]